MQEVVEDGATVITDCLGAYKSLKNLGYTHIAYNIKASGVQAHELLPAVHRASALLKRWILGTHQGAVSKELLDYYLAEFAFRYNRRYSRHRGLLFYRLAEQAMATEPRPYVELLTLRSEPTLRGRVVGQSRCLPARPLGLQTRGIHRRPDFSGSTLLARSLDLSLACFSGRWGCGSVFDTDFPRCESSAAPPAV